MSSEAKYRLRGHGMVEIPRDRWGKPLVIPPGGGKPVAYARASSFGDVLEDVSNLTKWKLRMAIKGVAQRPDLHLAATTTPLEERGRLNGIAEQAIEHAGGSRAATVGTSLHALTEMIDRGDELPAVPEQYAADLAAYRTATARFQMEHIEAFMVCDELQVAGTPDRIMLDLADVYGLCIGDLKTGGDNRYLGKHCVQLAVYAHSVLYDPATGERYTVNAVNRQRGVIFHAPAGQGRCDLFELDLEQGWQGALLAADVRAWRKRRGLAVAA